MKKAIIFAVLSLAIITLAKAAFGLASYAHGSSENMVGIPRLAQVVIHNATVDEVKTYVVRKALAYGFNLQNETPSTLHFEGNMPYGKALLFQMAHGDSQTTSPRIEARFGFIKVNDGVQVTVQESGYLTLDYGQKVTKVFQGKKDLKHHLRLLNLLKRNFDG